MQSFSNSKLSNFSPVMVTGRQGGEEEEEDADWFVRLGCDMFPNLARTAATEVDSRMDSYQPRHEIWNAPHWADWKPGSQYPVHICPPAVPLSVSGEPRQAPREAAAAAPLSRECSSAQPWAGADLYRVLFLLKVDTEGTENLATKIKSSGSSAIRCRHWSKHQVQTFQGQVFF